MFRLLIGMLAFASACGGSDGQGQSPLDADLRDSSAPTMEASSLSDGPDASRFVADAEDAAPGADSSTSCPRLPARADRVRKVVVSHPFQSSGVYAKRFEVLELDLVGTLSKTNITFEMGTASESPIAFTPDGLVGLVAQSDGSVGVFSFDSGGTPKVLHAAYRDGFYASAVVVDPRGDRAYVLDSQTVENNGGVYQLDIACDGRVTSRGRWIGGGRASAMAFDSNMPNRAVLASGPSLGAPQDADMLVVDLLGPSLLASRVAFPGTDENVSSVALTPDGKFALLADNGIMAGNRIAIVPLGDSAPSQVLVTEFPAQVLMSPYGNAAIVLNGDSTDHISVLSYAPEASTPFALLGRLSYKFPRPKLPYSAAMITQGSLKGRVLIAENLAIRQVQFQSNGQVVDTAQLAYERGIPNVLGVVGVQP